jgi:hypothetical protein
MSKQKTIPRLSPAWIDRFESEGLLIAAFRYYMGRRTISACHFAEHLAMAWPELPLSVQSIIRSELGEELIADTAARLRGDRVLPLGHNCDREAWEKVLEAWESMQ